MTQVFLLQPIANDKKVINSTYSDYLLLEVADYGLKKGTKNFETRSMSDTKVISRLDILGIQVSVSKRSQWTVFFLKNVFSKSATKHVWCSEFEFWMEYYWYDLTPLKNGENFAPPIFWVKIFASLKLWSGHKKVTTLKGLSI